MLMVDSSVWIDFFNGFETREVICLDNILGVYPVVIGDIILTEILQGFRQDSDYKTAKQILCNLPILQLSNANLALKSANNYRILRKKGITVRKTIDTIIATYCIENKIELLFSDKDFYPFVKFLNLKSAVEILSQS